MKLLCWLTESETGLLSELKLYGEERNEIAYFRMQSGEENPYHRELQEKLNIIDCVIYDMAKHALSSIPAVHISDTLSQRYHPPRRGDQTSNECTYSYR